MTTPPLTKLDVALNGVTHLGVDTAPYIYLVERNPAYLTLVRETFRRIDSGAVEGVSSIVTLTEVLTLPKRTGDKALEAKFSDLLRNSDHITLRPVG